MTIIEVMMAAVVLLIALVALFGALDGAKGATNRTHAREGATNLARQLIEGTRSIPFKSLSGSTTPTQLQGMPGLQDDNPGAGWQITRQGVAYTVTVSVCSLDDLSDGLGNHSSSEFCSGLPASGTADKNPIDLKRATVTLQWKTGTYTGTTQQSTAIGTRGASDLPTIKAISMSSPASSPITSQAVSGVTFSVTTSSTTPAVTWSVDGNVRGSASGSGSTWSFVWPITGLYDGTYQVGAQANDASSGLAGPSRSISVTLNRFAPQQPTGFNAGRNGSIVEAEWLENPERDVVGYRVYRQSGTQSPQLACSLTAKSSCVDSTPPSTSTFYWVVAVDRDPAGTLREGPASTKIDANAANTPPNPPTGLLAATTVDGTLLSWTLPKKPDPNNGDTIDFLRIYRDGKTIADRYDRTALGTDTTYLDDSPGSGSHTYWITAVDTHLAESTVVGPVTK